MLVAGATCLFFLAFVTMFLIKRRKKHKANKKKNKDLDVVREEGEFEVEENTKQSLIEQIKPDITSISEQSHTLTYDSESTSGINEIETSDNRVIFNATNTSSLTLINSDKELWICYRIVASYPLNYAITNDLAFMKPFSQLMATIKYIPSSNQTYCFAREHAIMIQWFFMTEQPDQSLLPQSFFTRKYQKSKWKSKVVKCAFTKDLSLVPLIALEFD
uniref:Major sperm protein n=1 Tax=Rhabditophanes sp. KR3021 TaxID=114890 RepID=A0AC35TKF4_9BILA